MALKNQYLIDLLETVKKRNAGEPEFIQAVMEVFTSLEPVVERRPDLVEAGVFERIVEPERQIIFHPYTAVSSNSSDLSRFSKTA